MNIAKRAAEALLGACLLVALTGSAAKATSEGVNPLPTQEPAPRPTAQSAPQPSERPAQQLTEQEREEAQMLRVDVLGDILRSNPEDAPAPLTARPQVYSTYHRDFEYSADVVLDGVFGSDALYFQVENYWDCQYGYAELQIDVSQLISQVPASLTFMVNGTPVVSS